MRLRARIAGMNSIVNKAIPRESLWQLVLRFEHSVQDLTQAANAGMKELVVQPARFGIPA